MDVVEIGNGGAKMKPKVGHKTSEVGQPYHFSDDERGKKLSNPILCEACEDYIDECICPEREVREFEKWKDEGYEV